MTEPARDLRSLAAIKVRLGRAKPFPLAAFRLAAWHFDERGQGLLVVLALIGLVSAIAYGYAALAGSTNQQSTLRITQLGEYRATDSGAAYALWYATSKGFPPDGVLSAPDPGDGNGAPTVTITDVRPGERVGPLHSTHGRRVDDTGAHTLVGSGDVFFTFTWTSDRVGVGTLNILFDTTATQAPGFAPQATVTMPAGQTTTTSTVTLPTSGPGTYYLHFGNVTPGADTHISSVDTNGPGGGHFQINYPGMRFQAISVRSGRTTALDAGVTRTAGVYAAVVNSWTLR